MIANGGIIPTNIGLDGKIGGACGGKWYGGVYGWGFTVIDPADAASRSTAITHHLGLDRLRQRLPAHRRRPLPRRLAQADRRGQLPTQKIDDGRTLYPHMYGDQGWYDYTPRAVRTSGALELYYWSMKADGPAARCRRAGWLGVPGGQEPGLPRAGPARRLRRDPPQGRRACARDTTTPDTRLADDPMAYNPATVDDARPADAGRAASRAPTARSLHCRVRYFDPDPARAGLPEDVAALVETTDGRRDGADAGQRQPVGSARSRRPGGGYGEHQFASVEIGDKSISIDRSYFTVLLPPAPVSG